MIRFVCPQCNNQLRILDSFGGKKGRCPFCKEVVEIPAGEAPPAGPPQSVAPPARPSPPQPAPPPHAPATPVEEVDQIDISD